MTTQSGRKTLPFLAILLLTLWPIAYAHDARANEPPIKVEAATASAAPGWHTYDRDSFYTTNNAGSSLSPQFYLTVEHWDISQ